MALAMWKTPANASTVTAYRKHFPGKGETSPALGLVPVHSLCITVHHPEDPGICSAGSPGFLAAKWKTNTDLPRQIKLSEFFLEVKWRLLSRTGSGQTLWKRPPRSEVSKKGRPLAPSLGVPLPGASSVGG